MDKTDTKPRTDSKTNFALIFLLTTMALWGVFGLIGVIKPKNSNNSIVTEKIQPTVSPKEKVHGKVNGAISNRTFISDENGLYTVIKFLPVNADAPVGAMMLSQNHCDYSFSYTINGCEIDATFINSSCGGTANGKAFTYDESHDWITTNIEGQTYIFKSN